MFLSTLDNLFAQDSLVVFDRPGVAESSFLTPRGLSLIETGYGLHSRFVTTDWLKPAMLFRNTIFSRTELRISANTIPQSYLLGEKSEEYPGHFFSLGFKRKLSRETGYLPETALLVNYYGVLDTKEMKNSAGFLWEACLVFNTTLSPDAGLNYNVSYLHQAKQMKGLLHFSLCYTYSLNEQWALFAESFNYLDSGTAEMEAGFDAGLTYLLNEQCQLDLSYIRNQDAGNIGIHSLAIGFSVGL